MNPAPRLIAVTMVLGASCWALTIATSPDEPFATDSGVLISIGLLGFALIAAVGLLLPRGRWARNLARGLLIFEIVLAAVVPLEGWALAALTVTGLGVVGIQGRWLDGWLRRLPAANGPGLKPMLFLLGSLALVPAIGIASPSGVEFRQGLFGAAGIIVAWGYSKAQLWGLWTGRIAIVPLAVIAAWAEPLAGAASLIAIGVAMSWLAWSNETRLAVSPLLDELPGPRRLAPRQSRGE